MQKRIKQIKAKPDRHDQARYWFKHGRTSQFVAGHHIGGDQDEQEQSETHK
jgi:hypothetical protein